MQHITQTFASSMHMTCATYYLYTKSHATLVLTMLHHEIWMPTIMPTAKNTLHDKIRRSIAYDNNACKHCILFIWWHARCSTSVSPLSWCKREMVLIHDAADQTIISWFHATHCRVSNCWDKWLVKIHCHMFQFRALKFQDRRSVSCAHGTICDAIRSHVCPWIAIHNVSCWRLHPQTFPVCIVRFHCPKHPIDVIDFFSHNDVPNAIRSEKCSRDVPTTIRSENKRQNDVPTRICTAIGDRDVPFTICSETCNSDVPNAIRFEKTTMTFPQQSVLKTAIVTFPPQPFPNKTLMTSVLKTKKTYSGVPLDSGIGYSLYVISEFSLQLVLSALQPSLRCPSRARFERENPKHGTEKLPTCWAWRYGEAKD